MARSPGRKGATAAAATANLAGLLSQAVAALNSNQPPLMATHAEMTPLVNYEGGALVECNEAIKDGDKVAWRATARGQEASNAGWLNQAGATGGAPAAQANGSPAPTSSVDASKFKFDDDIPIPEQRKGGRGSNAYGFEFMKIGQSFYVPATDENPNPAKRIASTVSGASKRLHPMTFIVRSVDETDKGRGKGARVFRTADSTEPKPA